MNRQPTTEDRIWAVASHLSAIALGIGILLPIVGWAEQRRKSKYASFQCLQALGYQSLGYTVWVLSYLLLIILLIVVMFVSIGLGGKDSGRLDGFMGIWLATFMIVIFGTLGIYFLLPVLAAVSCALGKEFRYPIMGNRLARYLGYDLTQIGQEQLWLLEDHEDRWVAAMGHFSILILLWGMLAPLTAWILQGKRNLFIKFQSMQTLAYQACVTALYFVALFVYFFGFLLLFAAMGLTREPQMGSPSGILGFAVFIIATLIAFGIFLLIPLFHILGQWAGYRVLKGDDYRYPLVGRLVEQWISKQPNSSEEEKSV